MYTIKKKNKDYKEALIEKKYEETITFTLAEVEAHQQKLEKVAKEIDAQLMVARAAMKNVENNHPNIKKVTDFVMHAISVYAQNKKVADDAQKNLREIAKQQAQYKKEVKEIKDALGIKE